MRNVRANICAHDTDWEKKNCDHMWTAAWSVCRQIRQQNFKHHPCVLLHTGVPINLQTFIKYISYTFTIFSLIYKRGIIIIIIWRFFFFLSDKTTTDIPVSDVDGVMLCRRCYVDKYVAEGERNSVFFYHSDLTRKSPCKVKQKFVIKRSRQTVSLIGKPTITG